MADKRSKGWLCDADNTRAKALATQRAFGDFIFYRRRSHGGERNLRLPKLFDLESSNNQHDIATRVLHLISITDTDTKTSMRVNITCF